MAKTVDTVERERERERYIYREKIFFSDAQKTIFVNTKEVGLNNKVTRMDYIAKKSCYVVCPFCDFKHCDEEIKND